MRNLYDIRLVDHGVHAAESPRGPACIAVIKALARVSAHEHSIGSVLDFHLLRTLGQNCRPASCQSDHVERCPPVRFLAGLDFSIYNSNLIELYVSCEPW